MNAIIEFILYAIVILMLLLVPVALIAGGLASRSVVIPLILATIMARLTKPIRTLSRLLRATRMSNREPSHQHPLRTAP